MVGIVMAPISAIAFYIVLMICWLWQILKDY